MFKEFRKQQPIKKSSSKATILELTITSIKAAEDTQQDSDIIESMKKEKKELALKTTKKTRS